MEPNIITVWSDMKIRLFALFMVFMACSAHVFADCATPGSFLTGAQLTSILNMRYVCGRSTALDPPGWNERHVGSFGGSSGALMEQHEGGNTVEAVGTWAVSEVNGRGRVTYSYGSSSPVYEVAVLGTGTCSGCTTPPQTLNFCGVSGGAPASLQMLITTAASSLSACPSNP